MRQRSVDSLSRAAVVALVGRGRCRPLAERRGQGEAAADQARLRHQPREQELRRDVRGRARPRRTSARPRGQGLQLSQYFAIGHVSLDNYIAEISGQGPSKQTQLDCFTYNDFVSTGTGDLGQALGDGCVYPTSVKTIADQLTAKKLTWKGYMEDMSTPCKHPELGGKDTDVVADGHRRPTPPATTRSSTSTRSSTHRAARRTWWRSTALDHGSGVDRRPRRTSRSITPNLCNDAHDASCPNGCPGRTRRLEHLAPAVGAEDHGVAGVQEGRPADRDVRRGRGRRRHCRRDDLLQHAHLPERRPARARSRRVPAAAGSARCSSRRSSSRGRPVPRRTTTSRCSAAWRTSSS